MFVVTHQDEINDIKLLRGMFTSLDIPVDNIWFFENYTSESKNEDVEKHVDLLEFLDKVLFMCEQNIRTIEAERKAKKEGKGWFRR